MDYTQYLFTDKPIPYKDIDFLSITVKDYVTFLWCAECLLIDKNSMPSIEIISMTYLRFLFYLADQGDIIHLNKFIMLISMVTKVDLKEINIYKRNDNPYFSIKGIEFDGKDLIEIKNIIFLQNDIEDIDYTIQKELRDSFAEAEKIKAKLSGVKPGNFEDNIICLMTALPGMTLNDIYDLPIRKFNKLLKRADHKIHYEIYLAASMSGMVKFKDKDAIKHWMCSLDVEDKHSGVKMGLDELQNKVATGK